jgi:hypothetical protein
VIRVERTWDAVEGPVDPKSKAGRRRVPIVGILRGHLVKLPLGLAEGLVFGRDDETAFSHPEPDPEG